MGKNSYPTITKRPTPSNAVYMKNLARLGAVFYFAAVFFVVFHNAGFQLRTLLETRFLVMLLMGCLGFIVILKVIQEETNESDEPDELD